MSESFLLSVASVLAMVPVIVLAVRRESSRDALFYLALGVAVVGPLAEVAYLFGSEWRPGFAPALWLTVAASVIVFAALAVATRHAWRLTPLLMPYLCLLGVVALIWQNQPARATVWGLPSIWVQLHIALSIVTFGTLSVATAAGLAVLLKERALRARERGALSDMLPSIVDSELLQVRLLSAAAVILGCGVLTGMAAQYLHDGRLMTLEHKTVFSIATFALIVALLIGHYVTGVRGRRAARVVLVAYLLLTLAYTGVKFVTDVALA